MSEGPQNAEPHIESPARVPTTLLAVGLLATLWSMSITAATPSQQTAIVQHGVGGPDVLKLENVPVLAPAEGEVLIRVYAAAINPVDWKRRVGGGEYAMDPNGLPVMIPGGDVAGVVEKVGEGVTELRTGQPVFAVVPCNAKRLNGGYSQYAVAPAGTVVAKPKTFTYAEAAGLGIAAVTGVRVVVDTKVSRGQRVLITGASGGVGSIAAQAAKVRGAYVIGTASGRANLQRAGSDTRQDQPRGRCRAREREVRADSVTGTPARREPTLIAPIAPDPHENCGLDTRAS
jgi:D-arabinose 1-dehydrogenase-like Zn-dependent alcohol dehydrogenase